MKTLVLVLFASLILSGCGSGDAGAPTAEKTVTPEVYKTTYSTEKLFPLVSTEATLFKLTGSDNNGGVWSGSWLSRGDGETVFEGQAVTKTTQQIELTLQGISSTSYVTSYYRADRSLYKAIYSGTTSGYAVQTNDFINPLSYKIGDIISGPAITSYINGVTDYQTSSSQITEGENGNAKVTATIHLASGTTGTTELLITPAGDLLSIKMSFQYLSGVKVNLIGSL